MLLVGGWNAPFRGPPPKEKNRIKIGEVFELFVSFK